MDKLSTKKTNLRNKKGQLLAKQNEKQGYLNTASDIGVIYDRLAEDKRVIREYRNSVKTFVREKFDTFSGDLYSNSYKTKMEDLISKYDSVISNIDINMDRLNSVRAQYENKAYKCNGVIGYLQSAINSLVHEIENWVN